MACYSKQPNSPALQLVAGRRELPQRAVAVEQAGRQGAGQAVAAQLKHLNRALRERRCVAGCGCVHSGVDRAGLVVPMISVILRPAGGVPGRGAPHKGAGWAPSTLDIHARGACSRPSHTGGCFGQRQQPRPCLHLNEVAQPGLAVQPASHLVAAQPCRFAGKHGNLSTGRLALQVEAHHGMQLRPAVKESRQRDQGHLHAEVQHRADAHPALAGRAGRSGCGPPR